MKTKTRTRPAFAAVIFEAIFLVGVLFAMDARSALRCDCTQVVDACSAGVSLDDDQEVKIESSNDGCSRVDYLVDGQPFTALVVGGETELPWQGQPLADPQIVVENCRVCADRSNAGAAAAEAKETEATTGGDQELESLIKVMPAYPRDAWTNGIEGDVTVEFSVNQQGAVQNIRLVSATNQLLVTDTIDAVSRFRFQPATQNGAPIVTAGVRERFSFRLLDGRDPAVTSATP